MRRIKLRAKPKYEISFHYKPFNCMQTNEPWIIKK